MNPKNYRLTLESGVPVSTKDITSSIIYYTPITVGDEYSMNVPHASQITFDIFIDKENDSLEYIKWKPRIINYRGCGIAILWVWLLYFKTFNWGERYLREAGREVMLESVDDELVSTDNHKWIYVGMAATTKGGYTEDSQFNRLLRNLFNRVERILLVKPTNSWNYTTTPVRQQRINAG